MHKRLIPLAYIFKKTISAFLPLADLGMARRFISSSPMLTFLPHLLTSKPKKDIYN